MTKRENGDITVCEAFMLIGELAYQLGARDIYLLEGCYELAIDEQWWVAVNAHSETIKCSRGADVKPYDVWVEYNGWPAASLNVTGGVFVAGSAANEETFIEALKARLRDVK